MNALKTRKREIERRQSIEFAEKEVDSFLERVDMIIFSILREKFNFTGKKIINLLGFTTEYYEDYRKRYQLDGSRDYDSDTVRYDFYAVEKHLKEYGVDYKAWQKEFDAWYPRPAHKERYRTINSFDEFYDWVPRRMGIYLDHSFRVYMLVLKEHYRFSNGNLWLFMGTLMWDMRAYEDYYVKNHKADWDRHDRKLSEDEYRDEMKALGVDYDGWTNEQYRKKKEAQE